MKKCIALLLTVLLCAGFSALGERAQAAPGFTRDVLVLFTSDVHCGVTTCQQPAAGAA